MHVKYMTVLTKGSKLQKTTIVYLFMHGRFFEAFRKCEEKFLINQKYEYIPVWQYVTV